MAAHEEKGIIMEHNSKIYSTYVEILRRELVPAMGCTEPIAVAYCAAKAREALGCLPERVLIEASGNIIKNVKGVTVPNSGGMKGMAAAAILGVVQQKLTQHCQAILLQVKIDK